MAPLPPKPRRNEMPMPIPYPMPTCSEMVHSGGMRSSIRNRLNGMPEDPAKRRHPGGRPKEAREEYRPVTVFGHEFPAAVVHVVEYAPTFERSLHARGITFADVKTADIADISAGNAGDKGQPDRKESHRAQYAAGVEKEFTRHEDRDRHEHFEKRPGEKQGIGINREGFEKRKKGAEHGGTFADAKCPRCSARWLARCLTWQNPPS